MNEKAYNVVVITTYSLDDPLQQFGYLLPEHQEERLGILDKLSHCDQANDQHFLAEQMGLIRSAFEWNGKTYGARSSKNMIPNNGLFYANVPK